MIILSKSSLSSLDKNYLHLIPIKLNLPKVQDVDIGSKKIKDLLQMDANLLAEKIATHLSSRKTVKKQSISSNYASVEFTAITPDSLFVTNLSSNPISKEIVAYSVTPVDIDTGKEEKMVRLDISEDAFVDEDVSCDVTTAASYYKAAYLLRISRDMQSKNPGGYYTILQNYLDIGDMPYLSAPLPEQIIGYQKGIGFLFSGAYPIPGINSQILEGDEIPSIMRKYKTNSYISRLSSIVILSETVSIEDVSKQVESYNLSHLAKGLNSIYTLNNDPFVIQLSPALQSVLTLKRQDLIWVFSELSRCFEMSGVVETGRIGTNLRHFQNKLKNLHADTFVAAIYPDYSPRDLEEFFSMNFNGSYKGFDKLIKQIDPNRQLYKLSVISGSSEKFNLFRNTHSFLSPGLIPLVPYLANKITIDNGVFQYKNEFTFQINPIATNSHSTNVNYIDALQTVLNNQSLKSDLNAIIQVIFWLNNETENDFLISKDSNDSILVSTPTHLLRKYSKLPFFSGSLGVKVAKGLIG